MAITQETILQALRQVKYPGYTRDIVSFGFVKNIQIGAEGLLVSLELSSADPQITQALRELVAEALSPFEKQTRVKLKFSTKEAQTAKPSERATLPNIKHKIAVSSGKGGVGKTTVAVNLAYALRAATGADVGLLDCDMYGPTVPLMLGAKGEVYGENGMITPLEVHGLKVMSMGLLIDENKPVVWRGPMIDQTIKQFIEQVNWGGLDYLIIDLPPGTGDAQLSLAKRLALDGALVVTTPQMAASQVAARGAQMWGKVEVPVLGVIENMSYYPISGGRREFPFGSGGGRLVAETLGVPMLAELPIDGRLRELADKGQPILAANPDCESARIYKELAHTFSKRLI
jgi:ATP-binding protein involved in chromosome partitioning